MVLTLVCLKAARKQASEADLEPVVQCLSSSGCHPVAVIQWLPEEWQPTALELQFASHAVHHYAEELSQIKLVEGVLYHNEHRHFNTVKLGSNCLYLSCCNHLSRLLFMTTHQPVLTLEYWRLP